MTQRMLQLTQHGKSLLIGFFVLNSLYNFISTFEKALFKLVIGKSSKRFMKKTANKNRFF